MLTRIREFIAANDLLHSGERIGVAVSGGVDSVVLLHVLRSLPDLNGSLGVCHVDHGLRPEAAEDAAFVEELARQYGYPFWSSRVDVRAHARARHLSLEMAARDLRYEALRLLAGRHGLDRIALGHHRDDQAETILLRLLRGTGLEGLSGMAPAKEEGLFVRPLLLTSRPEIRKYAEEQGLVWREDASNERTEILRNRIRHRLLPLLRAEYNPAVDRALLGLAALSREALDYLGHDLEAAWPALAVNREEAGGLSFAAAAIAGLPPPLARMALRRLLGLAGGDPGRLSQAATGRIWAFTQGGGRRLAVPGGLILTRHGDRFHLGSAGMAEGLTPCVLPVPGEVILPRGASLRADWWSGNLPRWEDVGRNEAYLDADRIAWPLLVRSRLPGDRLSPLGLDGSKKVKEILIEAKAPRERRSQVPIVAEAGGRIVWVAGHRLDGRFRVGSGTVRILRLSLTTGGRI